MTVHTKAEVEQAALEWLSGLGWHVSHGPGLEPDKHSAEFDDYGQVVLECRPRDAFLSELVSVEMGIGCPASDPNEGGSD